MALSSVFLRSLLVIALAEAASGVVRRVVGASGRVASDASGQAEVKSKGSSFWRSLRKDLEAKRKDRVSSDKRRDLLWQAVREVDDQFHQKDICKLEEGTTYAKEFVLLEDHTSRSIGVRLANVSKTNIASARECALMCAADSLEDHGQDIVTCKSFTYNKTAQVCKFFHLAQQARSTWNKDPCCTSGAPCNLDTMRAEIQARFQAELKSTMLSQKRLANELRTASDRLARDMKRTQALSLSLPQKAATHLKHALEKVTTQTKHAQPQVVEQKNARQAAVLALPKLKEPLTDEALHEVVTEAEHALGNVVAAKPAMPTKQMPTLRDHITPSEIKVKRTFGQWLHEVQWYRLVLSACFLILVIVLLPRCNDTACELLKNLEPPTAREQLGVGPPQ